jgi:hypothetical protein
VAEHDELRGKYQVHIVPAHGPGALARTARRVHSSLVPTSLGRGALPEVEIRDLGIYEQLSTAAVSA